MPNDSSECPGFLESLGGIVGGAPSGDSIICHGYCGRQASLTPYAGPTQWTELKVCLLNVNVSYQHGSTEGSTAGQSAGQTWHT